MPPCPPNKTAGTFITGVFFPCCVTSHTGPVFSVMSMRPSVTNAMRHGNASSATLVIVKGRTLSGAWVPALIGAVATRGAGAAGAAAAGEGVEAGGADDGDEHDIARTATGITMLPARS